VAIELPLLVNLGEDVENKNRRAYNRQDQPPDGDVLDGFKRGINICDGL